MENLQLRESNTLLITSHCFKVLLDEVLNHFNKTHNHPSSIKVTQLYGFGNFNPDDPSLKQEFEKLTGSFINGKYLYHKSRELKSGKPVLKLNGFYKTVLFQYIGYEDIRSFTENMIQDNHEKARQLELISSSLKDQTYYYVSYHFGEYKEIVKAQVSVFNNWKNMEYKYLYPQSDGTFKEFLYHATVRKRADILNIRTKTLMDGRMVDGGESILYIGYGDPGRSAFILGVFSAFDINNRIIAGKTIHEKCDSREEMITKSKARKIPAYIAQEIRNVRIENESVIPNDKLEISQKSPYSITYEKLPGNYHFDLLQNDKSIGDFSFRIDKDTFRITPLISGVLINRDQFEVIQNGSVIHFSFMLTGIALFSRLEVFFKTYYLSKKENNIRGVYSGLDIENRLVSGDVNVVFGQE
ncbi:MAG: hypothetical protein HKN68_13300 [Saprospiraceae bacterium]|nr:hypothetical protein [Saprospiraceae bacterium]